MAYPEAFLKLVMSGPLYSLERWSCSLNMANWGTTEPGPTEVPTAIITACSNFIGSAQVSGPALLDSIKLNLIGTDGKYVEATTTEHIFTTPVPGGASASKPAPQLALAISLMTDITRGHASRGRFYLPAPYAAPNSATDPRISTANASSMATIATTFLNALNAWSTNWSVCVASNVGLGTLREVKSVRVGRVLDTMRSRRTAVPEDYTVGADLSEYGSHYFIGGGGSF